jgi:hypothetical protein
MFIILFIRAFIIFIHLLIPHSSSACISFPGKKDLDDYSVSLGASVGVDVIELPISDESVEEKYARLLLLVLSSCVVGF